MKYLTDQDNVLYGGQETLFLVFLSDCAVQMWLVLDVFIH